MDGCPPVMESAREAPDHADQNCRAHRLVLLAPLLWPEVVDWAPARQPVAPDYWHRELRREVTTLFQPDCPGWTLGDKIALASAAPLSDADALTDCAARHGLPAACLAAWQRAFQTLSRSCETGGLNLGALQRQLLELETCAAS